MAKTPTRRPPVPKDVKAARALLDEVVDLRADNRELRKQVDAANRQNLAWARADRIRKDQAKAKARPKPKGDRQNGR